MQPITDYDAFFNEAKQKLTAAAELNSRIDHMKASLEAKKKELAATNRILNDTIDSRISSGRNAVTHSYDKEINAAQEVLRKADSDKTYAKEQEVRKRIGSETEYLHTEISDIKGRIKDKIKQDKIPGFCNTGLYFSLYYPSSLSDILIILVFVAVCFLVIPHGITLLLHSKSGIVLGLVYFACILVFGGLFILILNRTRLRHDTALKEIKGLRKNIKEDESKIEDISRSIREDQSEAGYDLAAYNDRIGNAQKEIARITEKKKAALAEYDEQTAASISNAVKADYQDTLDELNRAVAVMETELADMDRESRERTLELTEKYEPYVGKEFMKEDRLNALADIMKNGTFVTIAEAIEEYRKRMDA